MTQGTRGKKAEAAVKKHLQQLAGRADFNFMRLPDARAGSFQPTTADYLVVCRGLAHFIEVKEVQHDFRLPSKNFETAQRARLAAFRAAGALTWVLVYFSTCNTWRCTTAAYFGSESPPSWDMRNLPVTELSDFFTEIF